MSSTSMSQWVTFVLGVVVLVTLVWGFAVTERVLERRSRARAVRDRNALFRQLRGVRAATGLQLSSSTGIALSRTLRLLRELEREGVLESVDRYNETFLAARGGRPRRYYRIRPDYRMDTVSG